MALIFFGSLIFGYGLLGINSHNPVFGWMLVTVGLTMALRGVAEVAADLVTKRINEERKYMAPNQQHYDG